jgi:methionine-gamma-lyase
VSGEKDGVFYGRYGNPTTRTLEEKISKLEKAEEALGVSSGMVAISVALLALLKQGDNVLVTKDVYGGTYKFLTTLAPRFGISFDFVDCTNIETVGKAIQLNTKVLYLETPSNPCLTVVDIEQLSNLAHYALIQIRIGHDFAVN